MNEYISAFERFVSDIDSDCETIYSFLANPLEIGNNYKLNCHFFDVCIVTNKRLISGTTVYKKAYGRHGIYAFKAIKNCTIPYGISINKKSRLKINKREIKAGEIIYVGKSDGTSIISRITQHYKGESSFLGLDINFDLRGSSIFVGFLLKKEFKYYKSLIVNVAEKKLQQRGVILGNNNNFIFGR